MIPDSKWSPDQKWSPNWTANDPEPQMISDKDRKLSRQKMRNGMEFGFLDFFYLYFIFLYFIFFCQLITINYINIKKSYADDVTMI